ncbi:MAG: 1-acyl-sn-glycerol-3-phosphate acyltransferase [Chitinophagaceae bacterium]|nr:1-acyl-sn-glycerol-3-phosphate acyltransferase [Chitinophagaceae bacterium]
MLYPLLKTPAKFALLIYCRKLTINNRSYLKSNGPLLLACNHPNSFLDAIILATIFRQPVYSLARGDAFNKKWIAFLLRQMNILPVYREREGTEHLHKNYQTFDACTKIFKQKGIVLIFSEALCENEWHLRPLKKGTARLAAAAWQQGIPLKILPVALNYSSYTLFGKNVHLNFGSLITKEQIAANGIENGKLLNETTNAIQLQLQQMVYEIDEKDKQLQSEIFLIPVSNLKKILLSIPAAIGYLLHLPFYISLQKIIASKTWQTGHYDSAIVGTLFLIYPFYLLLLCSITYFIAGNFWWLITLFAMPFCAWSYVQLKQQTDRRVAND